MTGNSSCKSRIRRNTMICFHYGLAGIAVAAGSALSRRASRLERPFRATACASPPSPRSVIAVDDGRIVVGDNHKKNKNWNKGRTTTTRTGARTAIGKITMAIGKTTIKIGARTTTTRTGIRTGTRTGPIIIITGTRTGTIMPMCATGITGPITGSSSAASCSARSSRRPAWASCPTRPSPISAGTGPTRICIRGYWDYCY